MVGTSHGGGGFKGMKGASTKLKNAGKKVM